MIARTTAAPGTAARATAAPGTAAAAAAMTARTTAAAGTSRERWRMRSSLQTSAVTAASARVQLVQSKF